MQLSELYPAYRAGSEESCPVFPDETLVPVSPDGADEGILRLVGHEAIGNYTVFIIFNRQNIVRRW